MTRVVRHSLVDRLLHWATATSVIVLLATAFLPILGLEFAWVTIHWVAGIVLAGTVSAHVVRALFWKDLKSMWIGLQDLREAVRLVQWTFRLNRLAPALPGKYSLAQKAIHHVFTVVVVTTLVTGGLMLAKIDTPWWERDPYLLAEGNLGRHLCAPRSRGAAARHYGDDACLLCPATGEALFYSVDDLRLDNGGGACRSP